MGSVDRKYNIQPGATLKADLATVWHNRRKADSGVRLGLLKTV